MIDFNDNWQDNPAGGGDRGHHDRADRSEGIGGLADLAPGAYTAIVRGAGNRDRHRPGGSLRAAASELGTLRSWVG